MVTAFASSPCLIRSARQPRDCPSPHWFSCLIMSNADWSAGEVKLVRSCCEAPILTDLRQRVIRRFLAFVVLTPARIVLQHLLELVQSHR
jgi:hypothetical protein